MSKVSIRRIARVEGEAYCLMGLFDVNMLLLHGEGIKAFKLFQLETLSQTEDESVFAWENEDCYKYRYARHTMGSLAGSPLYFTGWPGLRLLPG